MDKTTGFILLAVGAVIAAMVLFAKKSATAVSNSTVLGNPNYNALVENLPLANVNGIGGQSQGLSPLAEPGAGGIPDTLPQSPFEL